MIGRKWSKIICKFVIQIVKYDILNIREYFSPKKIFIGHDTRFSYCEILDKIVKGIYSVTENIQVVNLGFVTTPQHHYLVKYNNNNPDFYINKYSNINLFDLDFKNLIIDCANGVGFLTLSKIREYWNLNFELVNTKIYNHNLLNHESGSDYVINDKKIP